MKISEQLTFSTTNILLSLALISLTVFYTNLGTAAAGDFSSAKGKPLIQIDDDDLVPPMVPDTPQVPQPGDMDDPALSPDSAIYEPEPVVEEPEPIVNQEQPLMEQSDPVVPQGDPLSDVETEGTGLK